MKKLLISMLIIGSAISLPIIAKAYTKSNTLDTLDTHKVLDMDFDNNDISNSVNNKVYTTVNGKGSLVSGIKGKAFEPKTGYIKIPKEDMNIGDSEYATVSLKYRYGGEDDIQMLCAFGGYDLYLVNGYLGFNTGNGDLYGVKYIPPTNEYIDIVAVFHKSDETKNKLYINGVKQTLSNAFGHETYPSSLNQDFYIANWHHPENPVYGISDNSIIDEVKVFKTNVTDKEASDLSKIISIPELTVENNNKNPFLNWATEILPENLIYNIDFEDPNNIPDFNYNSNKVGDITGGQKVDNTEYYNGYKSAFTPNTMNSMGNHYNYPATQSNRNIMGFGRLKLPSGTKLSLSYRVKNKTNGTTLYDYWGSGGFAEKLIYLKPKVVEYSPAGRSTVKVDSVEGLSIGQHLSSDKTDVYKEYLPQINRITDNLDGTYTLGMTKAFLSEHLKGDLLKTRRWVNPIVFPVKTNTNTEWTLINANTEVKYDSEYDSFKRGISIYLNTENRADSNVDDIKFGYATKVRLYRDNTKIYEGYGSELNDTSATDKVKPTEVTNIKTEMIPSITDRKVKFKFNPAIDKGSFYNYNISAVDNKGVETPKSKTQTIEVNSGIKGYSYVINKHSNTEPSNTVNTTSTELEYTIPANESGDYYLHIKAIDNEGNVSNTIHHKLEVPKLTVVPKHSENMIRLDWNTSDLKSKSFKVFQKKEGSSEFQSISATNFSKPIKVLNIHPIVNLQSADSIIPTEEFTNWKGEKFTIRHSGRLKRWMEEPNSEHPKGYGKGLIEIDLVDMITYNGDYENWLKDSNGEWKYDVVMVGTWDYNGNRYNNADMTVASASFLQQFADEGKGLLLGHDVISTINPIMTKQFSDDANMIIKYIKGVNGTTVNVKKKGVLTNFPWEISTDTLTIPYTHTQSQLVYGDVWMEFSEFGSVTDGKGEQNSYLTTWNNTAMIQTGHSNGRATPDEQKVLANTLFYLNQLSADNFLNDYSGQDITAPNKPSILNHSIEEDFININLNKTEDNGSDYEYYVEMTDMKNNSVINSNIAGTNIKTGFKGYSYVIDTKENTEPDNKIETSENNLKMKINNNQMYLHIKAIDNVGNASETLHFKIEDLVKPTLEFEVNPNGYTSGNVLINVIAKDVGSGVKEIVLPNGEVIKGTKASFTATQNGVYTFIAIDRMNNKTIQSITISNIDREKPTVTITNNKNWTNQNVQINISATD